MAIYALKGPSIADYGTPMLSEIRKFLVTSLYNGVVKFGWGYTETSDLYILKNKEWSAMDEDEIFCYKKSAFLLDIKKGDWIVQINLPEWGRCIAGQVIGEYQFGKPCPICGDFRHELQIDKNTIIEFDRNDDNVLPLISGRLKLQGAHWRIYAENEFFQSIKNLKAPNPTMVKPKDTKELYHLRSDFSTLLGEITSKIHNNNPGKKLEHFLAEVFRKVPNVIEVLEYGQSKGFGTDFGADLIVNYRAGISILDKERTEKMVVQIKSYEGEHYDIEAVKQIETAINKFNANYGMLITTGTATDSLEKALEELSNKLSKNGNELIPVELIAGNDVARFVLKYAPDLLL